MMSFPIGEDHWRGISLTNKSLHRLTSENNVASNPLHSNLGISWQSKRDSRELLLCSISGSYILVYLCLLQTFPQSCKYDWPQTAFPQTNCQSTKNKMKFMHKRKMKNKQCRSYLGIQYLVFSISLSSLFLIFGQMGPSTAAIFFLFDAHLFTR